MPKVLLAVLAHPDDESMGTAGLLVRHARAGIPVHLVCATRGGAGWQGKPPGARREDLPVIRSGELEAAGRALGLSSVELWDYPDGGLEACDQEEIVQRIMEVVRTLAPAAVVGWGPDGAYGHPDHVALGRCTDEAVALVDDAMRPALYHMALDEGLAQAYRDVVALAGEDAEALPIVAVPEVGPLLDLTPAEIQAKLDAIDCHVSQLEDWRVAIKGMPDLLQRGYGREGYVAASGGSPRLGARGLLAEFS